MSIGCMNFKPVSISLFVLLLIHILKRISRQQRNPKMCNNAYRAFYETSHDSLKKRLTEKQFTEVPVSRKSNLCK